MAKHLAKVCWHGRQMRLTIPKIAVRALKWEEVRYLLMEETADGTLLVRRFASGESLESDGKRDPPGSDR